MRALRRLTRPPAAPAAPRYLGINASARASLYLYNTESEVDDFIRELEEVISFFGGGS